MNKLFRIFQTLFGAAWLVFGTQHFWYVETVAKIVPAYFPARVFFAYLTGAAMIAGGLSLIAGVKAKAAAASLGVMLLAFFLLIQVPKMIEGNWSAVNWTRIFQDFAIASAAFMLAWVLSKRSENDSGFFKKIGSLSRYVFAALLVVFGIEQFFDLAFLTAKVPEYLPFRIFFLYLTGAAMITTGASVFINKKIEQSAIALGMFLLLLNLLRYAPLFLTGAYNALLLTAAMLDLTIICGVFFLAFVSPDNEKAFDENAGR